MAERVGAEGGEADPRQSEARQGFELAGEQDARHVVDQHDRQRAGQQAGGPQQGGLRGGGEGGDDVARTQAGERAVQAENDAGEDQDAETGGQKFGEAAPRLAGVRGWVSQNC